MWYLRLVLAAAVIASVIVFGYGHFDESVDHLRLIGIFSTLFSGFATFAAFVAES